ncbi:MAG: hypothetical protein ACFFB7_07460 [Candidatus Sifarchaeia archaeon]
MVTTLKQHANGIRPEGLVDRVFDDLDSSLAPLGYLGEVRETAKSMSPCATDSLEV